MAHQTHELVLQPLHLHPLAGVLGGDGGVAPGQGEGLHRIGDRGPPGIPVDHVTEVQGPPGADHPGVQVEPRRVPQGGEQVHEALARIADGIQVEGALGGGVEGHHPQAGVVGGIVQVEDREGRGLVIHHLAVALQLLQGRAAAGLEAVDRAQGPETQAQEHQGVGDGAQGEAVLPQEDPCPLRLQPDPVQEDGQQQGQGEEASQEEAGDALAPKGLLPEGGLQAEEEEELQGHQGRGRVEGHHRGGAHAVEGGHLEGMAHEGEEGDRGGQGQEAAPEDVPRPGRQGREAQGQEVQGRGGGHAPRVPAAADGELQVQEEVQPQVPSRGVLEERESAQEGRPGRAGPARGALPAQPRAGQEDEAHGRVGLQGQPDGVGGGEVGPRGPPDQQHRAPDGQGHPGQEPGGLEEAGVVRHAPFIGPSGPGLSSGPTRNGAGGPAPWRVRPGL